VRIEGVVIGELVTRRDLPERLQLGPAVPRPRHARLDHHVGLAAVVHPARLIDHVEEDAVLEHERPGVVSNLARAPQHAFDVGDHRALRKAPGRDDAEAIDGRTNHPQAGQPRHQASFTFFFDASSR
jgi:hypothetical protein